MLSETMLPITDNVIFLKDTSFTQDNRVNSSY